MGTSLRSTLFGLLLLAVVCGVRGQDSKSQPPLNLDYSNDPCGNPLIESQLWITVDGKVSQVLDGETLLIVLPNHDKPLRVRLVGILLETSDPFAGKTKEALSKLLQSKLVEIIVNPDWVRGKEKPSEVTGIVRLKKGTSEVDDVGLFLLSQGLAKFQEPRPFTMSRYIECQYKRAESDAKSKRIGMWAGS